MRKSIFVILVLALGCDGSSVGTATCGAFTPCGGSIVGTWRITGVCSSSPDAGTSNCPGEQISTTMQYTGTLTFLSTGTYSVSASISGNAKFTYPASCLTSSNITCAQVDTSLRSAGTTDAGVSGSCSSTSAGGCTCTETMSSVQSGEEGTYTTSGSTLSMTSSSSSSTPEPTEYCVRGNQLTIHVTSAGSGTSTTLTATK